MTSALVWTRRCPACDKPIAKREPMTRWICACGWSGLGGVWPSEMRATLSPSAPCQETP